MASSTPPPDEAPPREQQHQQQGVLRWTPTMDAMYEAAVEAVGGIDVAKPRAVYDAMATAAGAAAADAASTAFAGTELAGLTVQAVKWKLLAHRRRNERRRHMEPAGITPPTKWTGALAEAYEAELARLGGLQAATPKPLYAALTAAGFEHITLQVVKTHLQKQRRREQQQGQQRAASGQPGESGSGGGGATTGGGDATPAGARSMVADSSVPVAMETEESAEPQTTPQPAPRQAAAQRQSSTPSVRSGSRRRSQPARGPAAPQPPPAQQQQQAVQPLVQQQQQQSPAPQQQQQQSPALQQQQPVQLPPPVQQRPSPAPQQAHSWMPFTQPSAEAAAVVARSRVWLCRQAMFTLELQALQLQALVRVLEQQDASLGGLALDGSLLLASLPPSLQPLARRLQPRSDMRGLGGPRLLGGGLAMRQQRSSAQIASTFNVVRPQAQAAPQAPQSAVPHVPLPASWLAAAHDPRACATPGCPLCVLERELALLGARPSGELIDNPFPQQHPHQW